jgi:hypothetical protein
VGSGVPSRHLDRAVNRDALSLPGLCRESWSRRLSEQLAMSEGAGCRAVEVVLEGR